MGGQRHQRPRLVLPFALVSLLLFVSIGLGTFEIVARQFLGRGEEAARSEAQFVASSIVQWESVYGHEFYPQLDYVRSELLRWPIQHVKIWIADGTVIFSDASAIVGRRFPIAEKLATAFATNRSVGEVAARSDAQAFAQGGRVPTLYASYIPVSSEPGGGRPEAVIEVFQSYASITKPVDQLGRIVFLVLIVGLATLWMMLLPVMYRISNRLARQNSELRQAEEQGRAMQAERAKLFDRTVQATEQERRRVALELHDGPVQHLAALDLILEGVSLGLDQSRHSKAETKIRTVQGRLRDEVKGLRHLMTELRPPALDERGLEAALRDHLKSVHSQAGLECVVDSTVKGRLGDGREITLYRVAQEALTNVAKHAEASHAWVQLREVDGHIQLEVRDDGRGFDLAHLADLSKVGHFGVIGMRERVEMAGGRWELESTPGRGTTVRATFPKELAGDARSDERHGGGR